MATYLRDIPNNIHTLTSVGPINVTANVSGLPGDFINTEGRCTLIAHIGVCNTLTNLAIQVTESTDNSTFTNISGALITILNTSSPTNTTQYVSFDRTARYICTTIVATGSNLNMNTAVEVVAQKKQV